LQLTYAVLVLLACELFRVSNFDSLEWRGICAGNVETIVNRINVLWRFVGKLLEVYFVLLYSYVRLLINQFMGQVSSEISMSVTGLIVTFC
jgi:hypothetical protein